MARSICPLDCPDSCTLEVAVEDGIVTSVDGTEENPLTQGFICSKVRDLPRWLYGDGRVRTPLRRTGKKGESRFEPISWDDALDAIADTLSALPSHRILPLSYGGSNGLLSQDTTDLRFFSRLGSLRLARTVCAAATGAATKGLYGSMPGMAFEDYAQAKVIVVWGINPHATGIHILPHIHEAQKRGAKLLVVDPRVTKLAAKADLHLAPRPGTDLPLALSVMHELERENSLDLDFIKKHTSGWESLRERVEDWPAERAAEVCAVPAEAIRSFARLYGQGSPAALRCGWGLERNRNGASAVAAVLALPAVAGKFGVRGGGYTLSNTGAWSFDPAAVVQAESWETPVVNMNQVGAALVGKMDPPIDGLFVYNCNPLMTLPNQADMLSGLERDDLFTVVFDSFLTDTARYADVVLPATTFVERRELQRSYGAFRIQESEAVIEPVGESRTNHEVFAELCRRMGLEREGDALTEQEIRDGLLNSVPGRTGLPQALTEEGVVTPEWGTRPIQFETVFPRTPDGKVHLFPQAMDDEAPEGLYTYREDPGTEAYPLALISPATSKTVSSMLGHLHTSIVPAVMHPHDAAARRLEAGATVSVFNATGEVVTRLEVSDRVRPGVVVLPKGLWAHNTLNGSTSNVLSPDTLTDCGGGACFNDARVEVKLH